VFVTVPGVHKYSLTEPIYVGWTQYLHTELYTVLRKLFEVNEPATVIQKGTYIRLGLCAEQRELCLIFCGYFENNLNSFWHGNIYFVLDTTRSVFISFFVLNCIYVHYS